jgi:ubiquinone/menaquinone biosynthesis C-methylase UbiE
MDKQFEQDRHTWDQLGEIDPLWAILSSPGKRGNRWDLESFFAKGRHEIDELLRVIANRFPDVPRSCALDFGCGVGRLTRSLAAHFGRVIGVDVAESMIRHAKKLNSGIRNCEFVLNERNDLKAIESGSVDFIYSALVLQHIAPPHSERYLHEFVRVLSSQGLVMFQVIDQAGESIIGRLSRIVPDPLIEAYRCIRYGQQRIKIYEFPAKRIHEAVSRAGAQVIQQENIKDPTNRWKKKRYFVRKSTGGE